MTCDTCKANKVCDHNKYGFENCENYISEDVVEVKHGKWISIADFGNNFCIGYCSECGTAQTTRSTAALKLFHKYCRWCGAKMDGEQRIVYNK